MILNYETDPRAVGVGCDLIARASVRASAEEIAALRKAPGRLGEVAVASKVLTHADEQTVVGLSAVLKAIADFRLDPKGFDGWGVVAAPSFLGRAAFESAFPQFLGEGAWGVSPLLISCHSLHSVSGVVSQVLHARGPNLGVGGTPGGAESAFLAAAAMLTEGSARGVWVVVSGWEGADDGGTPKVCEALALALSEPRPGWSGPRMVIAPGAVRTEPPNRRIDDGHDREPEPHVVPAGDAHRV